MCVCFFSCVLADFLFVFHWRAHSLTRSLRCFVELFVLRIVVERCGTVFVSAHFSQKQKMEILLLVLLFAFPIVAASDRVTIKINPGNNPIASAASNPTAYHYTAPTPTESKAKRSPEKRSLPIGFPGSTSTQH